MSIIYKYLSESHLNVFQNSKLRYRLLAETQDED